MKLVGETIEEFKDFEILQFAEEAGGMIAEAIKEDNFNRIRHLNERQQVNEGAVLLTLSTVLAAPALVKVIGFLIKKASGLFKFKAGENAGEKLQSFAHKAEHKLQQPINWILKKIGVKDEKKRSKWTKGIFALVIILLGIYSGLEAVQAFKAANVNKTVGEGLLTALKGGETGESLLTTIKSATAKSAIK